MFKKAIELTALSDTESNDKVGQNKLNINIIWELYFRF